MHTQDLARSISPFFETLLDSQARFKEHSAHVHASVSLDFAPATIERLLDLIVYKSGPITLDRYRFRDNFELFELAAFLQISRFTDLFWISVHFFPGRIRYAPLPLSTDVTLPYNPGDRFLLYCMYRPLAKYLNTIPEENYAELFGANRKEVVHRMSIEDREWCLRLVRQKFDVEVAAVLHDESLCAQFMPHLTVDDLEALLHENVEVTATAATATTKGAAANGDKKPHKAQPKVAGGGSLGRLVSCNETIVLQLLQSFHKHSPRNSPGLLQLYARFLRPDLLNVNVAMGLLESKEVQANATIKVHRRIIS